MLSRRGVFNVQHEQLKRSFLMFNSGDVKGMIRSAVRLPCTSTDVRRHRLISISYISLLPCHGRGRGFESRRPRHSFQNTWKRLVLKTSTHNSTHKASARLHSPPQRSGIHLALPEFRHCLPACRDPKLSGFSRDAGCLGRSSVLLNPPKLFAIPARVVSTSKSQ